MDMTTILLAMVLVGVGFVMYVMGKDTNKKDKFNTASAGLIIFGVVLLGAGAGGYLSFDNGSPVEIGGDSDEVQPDNPVERPIDTVTYTGIDAMSNSRTDVSGTVEFYNTNDDPTSPTAVYVDSISISSGNGNTTDKVLKTDREYKVIFDGSSSYYDVDMGSEVFNFVSGLSTQTFSEEFETTKIATISDLMDETETSDYFSSSSGNATTYNADGQLIASGSTVTYISGIEAGTFTLPVTISVTGGNAEIKDAVMCFEWDTTNPPSGDEYTSITANPITGKTFPALEGDLINHWSTQSCVPLGDLNGGTYAKYNLVFTTVDANIDSNDDWTLAIDDMGEYLGKDIAMGTKASAQTESIDHLLNCY